MSKNFSAVRGTGRAVVGVVMLAVASLLALMAMTMSSASAKVIAGAITGVTVTPANPGIYDPVTVDTTWCVPDGSKQGDTFTLTLPPQLTPYSTGFAMQDAAGDTVANAVIANGVVTFTLTPFAETHTGVCGTAFFKEAIVHSQVTVNQPTTLQFDAGGTIYRSTITPKQGTGGNHTTSRKYGNWTNKADQGRTDPTNALQWYIDTPTAPSPNGDTQVVFVDNADPGQAFNCPFTQVRIGTFSASGAFVSDGVYSGPVTRTCSASAITVTAGSGSPGSIPAGKALHLVLTASITDQSLTSFSDSGSVDVNGQGPQKVTAQNVVRFDSGGSASGTVAPPSTPVSSPSSSAPPVIVRPSSGAPSTATSTASVVVAAAATPPLASTGSDTRNYTLIGVGLLAVGGALLLISARWNAGKHVR